MCQYAQNPTLLLQPVNGASDRLPSGKEIVHMKQEDRASVSRRSLTLSSGSVLILLVVLFVVSLVALLGWLAYFVFDATFLGRPAALGGLWLTAAHPSRRRLGHSYPRPLARAPRPPAR